MRVEVDADTETPVSAFLKLSRGHRHAFLLESVEGGERSARFSFLGAGPRRLLRWKLGDPADPIEAIRAALVGHTAVRVPGTPRFSGGLVGHVAYDAVRLFEPRVPISRPDELGFPDVLLGDYDEVVAFDNVRHSLHLIQEVRCDFGDDPRALYAAAVKRLQARLKALARPLVDRRARRSATPAVLSPRVSKAAYLAAVEKAKGYIRAGDCQQIVLSQRFDAEVSVSPFEIYRALRRVNPSPYLFYLQDGDRALVGSSPETLIKLEEGEVTLRPIAGTRKRGATPAEDAALEAELRADPKENAEHVMLVDLGRNDVGRVAADRQRADHRAEDRGALLPRHAPGLRGAGAAPRGRLSAVDVLQAGFPAGTVSGSPKVRAMEIIDELEPARRGPYAGAVGYFDRGGNMEMCIAIRTLMARGRHRLGPGRRRAGLRLGAGGRVPGDGQQVAGRLHRGGPGRGPGARRGGPAAGGAPGPAEGAGEAEGRPAEAGDDRRPKAAASPSPGGRSDEPPVAGRIVRRVRECCSSTTTTRFTCNLVQYLGELGAEVSVFRNDAIDVAGIRARAPDGLVLSPGPCTPDEAGCCLEVLRELSGAAAHPRRLPRPPGHRPGLRRQGDPQRPHRPRQGEPGGARRHRPLRRPAPPLPGRALPLAGGGAGHPAAGARRSPAGPPRGRSWGCATPTLEVEGVQFHPESILTEAGKPLLANWLARLGRREDAVIQQALARLLDGHPLSRAEMSGRHVGDRRRRRHPGPGRRLPGRPAHQGRDGGRDRRRRRGHAGPRRADPRGRPGLRRHLRHRRRQPEHLQHLHHRRLRGGRRRRGGGQARQPRRLLPLRLGRRAGGARGGRRRAARPWSSGPSPRWASASSSRRGSTRPSRRWPASAASWRCAPSSTCSGPLANPAGARHQVMGVYEPRWVPILGGVLAALGSVHAFVVHGDGLDEITVTGMTHVAEVKDGAVERYCVLPEDLGLPRHAETEIAGGDATRNAVILRDVLSGQKGAPRDAVLANASAALVCAGAAADLKAGVVLAARSIDQGAAAEKLRPARGGLPPGMTTYLDAILARKRDGGGRAGGRHAARPSCAPGSPTPRRRGTSSPPSRRAAARSGSSPR